MREWRAKLTLADIVKIKELRLLRKSLELIGEEFGLTPGQVKAVVYEKHPEADKKTAKFYINRKKLIYSKLNYSYPKISRYRRDSLMLVERMLFDRLRSGEDMPLGILLKLANDIKGRMMIDGASKDKLTLKDNDLDKLTDDALEQQEKELISEYQRKRLADASASTGGIESGKG